MLSSNGTAAAEERVAVVWWVLVRFVLLASKRCWRSMSSAAQGVMLLAAFSDASPAARRISNCASRSCKCSCSLLGTATVCAWRRCCRAEKSLAQSSRWLDVLTDSPAAPPAWSAELAAPAAPVAGPAGALAALTTAATAPREAPSSKCPAGCLAPGTLALLLPRGTVLLSSSNEASPALVSATCSPMCVTGMAALMRCSCPCAALSIAG
mmetsp:Transcript_17177/g.54183  ORF Transcript_17177/g.54183 Transcript_17177/m.54183 type:complete len:210 (+) Transcript_17177:1476-2105(+)